MRIAFSIFAGFCTLAWCVVLAVWCRGYFVHDGFEWREHSVTAPGQPRRVLGPTEPWPVELIKWPGDSRPLIFGRRFVLVQSSRGRLVVWNDRTDRRFVASPRIELRQHFFDDMSLYAMDEERSGHRWVPTDDPLELQIAEQRASYPLEYLHEQPWIGVRIESRVLRGNSGLLMHLYEFSISYWAPALLLSWAPAMFIRRGVRRWYRLRRGLCPACGYDLRASPEKCPECGREVTPRGAGAAPAKAPAPEGQ